MSCTDPAAIAHTLPTAANVPGGVALVKLGTVSSHAGPPRAWLGDQPVWVSAENGQWTAIVGLALDMPAGTHELRVSDSVQQKSQHFEVGAKYYPEQRITLKDSGKVNLSASDEARAEREIAAIQKLKRHWRETDKPGDTDSSFLLPAEG